MHVQPTSLTKHTGSNIETEYKMTTSTERKRNIQLYVGANAAYRSSAEVNNSSSVIDARLCESDWCLREGLARSLTIVAEGII